MHVLYIDQYFYTDDQPGRIRGYAFARHLVAQGHQVTVITPYLSSFTGSIHREARGRFLYREERDGIDILRVYAYPRFMKNARVRLIHHFSFMASAIVASLSAGPCDAVYATSPPPTVALGGYVVGLLKRAPFVFEVRDLWPEGPIASSRLEIYDVGIPVKPLTFGVAKRLVRFLYRQAAKIVILTPAFRAPIVAQGGRDADIQLVSHGIDPASVRFLPQARERLRQEHGVQEKFVITYAGTFGFNQRLDFALDVADLVRERSDIVFWLIGDGPTKKDLVREARERRLSNVTFFDAQSYNRMPEFFSASDLCLIALSGTPVHETVWPNKLFNYMACRRPVLINFDGLTRRTLQEAKAGFYVPRQPEVAAERIRQLADDPALLQRAGRNARAYVTDHFDIADKAQAFEDVLRAACEGK
jgi:glycosyltransferase involved in cell wall biosynthesis